MTRASANTERAAPLRVAIRGSELAALRGNATRACAVLKALANEVRLMLVCQLADGEKTVGELQQSVGLSQSAVSQHLALLREHKLVATRRDGQSIHYTLASVETAAIIKTLHEQFCARRRS
ncbi:MAG TPA: metalloregulator ArsR/SmtB family transcription factor [Steroidobacteraceae bacterium]|nr:metalloregulator ArsR/SmtB family transcription factor [Steroidobacteraceae bacterium]